ncbi:hypothetical protein LTR36_004279 [Oleoguttula mirabilis]|uniref:Uncharacterized protein n=1 Tax=Oleoguttula mirabilis TaxID=1507867 RepID=A0AAV9JHE0_9PEZI|nr:hypothetical protein LTR36_004279 [Oleoguttula mirabilis]
MATAIQPPILRLPPELRNRIYSELLADIEQPFLLTQERLSPPILDVCRQTREECGGMFYSTTVFQFDNPAVCSKFLLGLSNRERELVQEIRYDCSETCTNPASWRRAFLDLPGLNEDEKLGKLKSRLAEHGIFLQGDVLKAGIRINGRLVWTTDPLSEARHAVRNGSLVGRVMFV